MDVTITLVLKDCAMATLGDKTDIFVTHQVECFSKVD
jgi:hypothetical protein